MASKLFKKMFQAALLFSAFICIIVLSVFFTISFFIKSEETVVVPDLTEVNILEAVEIISDLDLNVRITRSVYSNEYPENMVISQEPEPGTELKKGRNIKLTYSHGIQYVIMPNLSHLNIDEAKIIIEKKGLLLNNISKQYSSEIGKDSIIDHLPRSGFSIERGSPIDLLISAGSMNQKVIIPEFKGKSIDNAFDQIEKYHFNVGQIVNQYDKKLKLKSVTEQYPLPGSVADMNSSIDLTINSRDNIHYDISKYADLDYFYQSIDYGFLNKHVKLNLNIEGNMFEPINDYYKPGSIIYFLIPGSIRETVHFYIDGTLLKTNQYNMYLK